MFASLLLAFRIGLGYLPLSVCQRAVRMRIRYRGAAYDIPEVNNGNVA